MLVDRSRTALLSDGTTLDDLVAADGPRLLSPRIMTDPEIFALEMDRIFRRTWVFVAFESEIPLPGDFVLRYVGPDQVIVTRDDDGGVHVLLNVCSHRGSPVCAADRGSAELFRCPYHAWVYDNTGRMVGALAEKEVYRSPLDKQSLGLRAARVEICHGLVFATWNDAGPGLDEHLGETRFYFDLLFGATAGGIEALGPPHRWVIAANWKLASDNFSTDSYHPLALHRSIIELGLVAQLDEVTSGGILLVSEPATAHSTALLEVPIPPGDEGMSTLAQMMALPADRGPEVASRLTPEQREFARDYYPGVGGMFPNIGWLRGLIVSEMGGPPEPFFSLRVWRPIAPDVTELWSWALAPRDATEEVRTAIRRGVARTFGTSGMIEQDDGEAWSGIQRVAEAAWRQGRRYRYLAEAEPDPDWRWPGVAYPGFPSEDNEWNFYLRWRDMLGAEEAG